MKTLTFRIVGTFFIGSILFALTPRTDRWTYGSDSDGWPMFRHDAQHTGYTTSTAPATLSSEWNFSTYGQEGVASSPSADYGKVFVGSDDRNIYAIDETTGALVWYRTTGGRIYSSPAIHGGIAFVGSYDGKICAMHENNGTDAWGPVNLGLAVHASPIVTDGMLFVGAYGQVCDPCQGHVYALNETTGAIVWNVELLHNPQYITQEVSIFSSPAFDGGRIFIGAHQDLSGHERTAVVAINFSNGQVIWDQLAFNRYALIHSSPAVSGGMIFIGCDDGVLYTLSENDGHVIRQFATGGAIMSSPAVDSTYVIFGSNDGNVYCLTKLGAFRWNYTTGGPVRSSPTIADGKVFVGSDDGCLYVFDENNGALIDRIYLGDKVESSPAVADGMVFVGSNTGRLYAFESSLIRASFEWSPEKPTINQTMTFDASASLSRGGSIVRYEWDFGDGKTAATTQPNTSHIYTSPGKHYVTLRVIDNRALIDTENHSVKICYLADLNKDGIVDIQDIVVVAMAFAARPGDGNWNQSADIAEPFSIVNILDIYKVAKDFGKDP